MLEADQDRKPARRKPCFCNVCSHQWTVIEEKPAQRFRSIDDLVRRVVLRRDEIAMLAEIGALNSLGHDRRSGDVAGRARDSSCGRNVRGTLQRIRSARA